MEIVKGDARNINFINRELQFMCTISTTLRSIMIIIINIEYIVGNILVFICDNMLFNYLSVFSLFNIIKIFADIMINITEMDQF